MRDYTTQLGTLTPSVIAAGSALLINTGTLNNLLLGVDGTIVIAADTLGGETRGPAGIASVGFSADASATGVGRTTVDAGQQGVLGATRGSGAVGVVTDGGNGIAVGGTILSADVTALTGRSAASVALLGGTTGVFTVAGKPLTLGLGTAVGQLVGVPARSAAAFQIGLGGLVGFAMPGSRFLIETNAAFTNQTSFFRQQLFPHSPRL